MLAQRIPIRGGLRPLELPFPYSRPDGKPGLLIRPDDILRDLPFAGPLFHGLPVQTVADGGIAPEEAVCLAVHEALVGEIRPLLAGRTDRIYPVYPYLTELCYGAPIGTEEWPLMKLLERQDPSYYWLTVRYAAARDHRFHRNTKPLSEELYVRAMAIHSSVSTAKKRLAFLHALIDGMAADGWRNDRPIFAEEDGRIVDGLHRTACAACLGIERVTVTVPTHRRTTGCSAGKTDCRSVSFGKTGFPPTRWSFWIWQKTSC